MLLARRMAVGAVRTRPAAARKMQRFLATETPKTELDNPNLLRFLDGVGECLSILCTRSDFGSF